LPEFARRPVSSCDLRRCVCVVDPDDHRVHAITALSQKVGYRTGIRRRVSGRRDEFDATISVQGHP
jgi:hypothetical protein